MLDMGQDIFTHKSDLKIRDTINLAAYNLQEEFGIDLSTPQLESSVKK